MKPFVKLDATNKMMDISFDESMIYHGVNRSIEFFKISSIIEQHLLEIIPIDCRKYFKGSFFSINTSYIRPHTDSDRKVGINFYVTGNNAITKFFKIKEDATVLPEKVFGQTNGSVYREHNLVSTGIFKATPGEIWILDVSQIHSVTNIGGKDRVAYTLSSNILSYNDTLEIFNLQSSLNFYKNNTYLPNN
jgi:hypothetical protein